MQHILFEMEAGVILLEGDSVVLSYSYKQMPSDPESVARWVASMAKEKGIGTLIVSKSEIAEALRRSGIESSSLPPEEMDSLKSRRLSLMVSSGLAADQSEALEFVRQSALKTTEEAIMVESSRQDLHLVQAIQALDDLDRFLNLMTERVSEWYGLHFPELTQIMQDNVLLSKLIVET